MATFPKRNDSTSLRSHQLPTAPLLGLGPRETSSHPCWTSGWYFIGISWNFILSGAMQVTTAAWGQWPCHVQNRVSTMFSELLGREKDNIYVIFRAGHSKSFYFQCFEQLRISTNCYPLQKEGSLIKVAQSYENKNQCLLCTSIANLLGKKSRKNSIHNTSFKNT